MTLVLPYGLPPAAIASALADQLGRHAPTLLRWFESATARLEDCEPAEVFCTPYQAWRLRHAGYQPANGVPLGSGWAVLQASAQHTEPHAAVWLAHFVHFAVSERGVALVAPELLGLTEDEFHALLDAVRPEFVEAGIRVEPLPGNNLKVHLPDDVLPYAPTLEAMIGQDVDPWWPQQPQARPWRRTLNAIQMVWHDHPVNQHRIDHGLLPVNGVWLHGGGRYADFHEPVPAAHDELSIAPELELPFRHGDWAGWLKALATLEAQYFQPLQVKLERGELGSLTVVVTGERQVATLEVRTPRFWQRWLPRRRGAWKHWWAPPVRRPPERPD